MVVEACADKTLDLFPLRKTKGDAEFKGHGPHVELSFKLTRTESKVSIEGCVVMTELESDWTTGEACNTVSIDVENTELVTPDTFNVGYTDSDHDIDDVFAESSGQNPNEVIKSATCVGDTDGDDICIQSKCSRCTIEIGCVHVKQ